MPHIPKYIITKANWTMFRNKLNDKILNLNQESNTSVVTADTHAEVVTSILTHTANHAIPKTTLPNSLLKHALLKNTKLFGEQKMQLGEHT